MPVIMGFQFLRSLAGLAIVAVALPAAAGCPDEQRPELQPAGSAATSAARAQLRQLVERAVQRSQAVGASRLLAEAAKDEIDEAKAAWRPQASFNSSLGGSGTRSDGLPDQTGSQLRGGVNLSSLIYDGGHAERLVDWRRSLAEAARLGEVTAEEQVALQSVSLALDRERYSLQARVYEQYERKMACLVDSLQQIVAVDKGRASELVQARKTLEQAALSASQARSGVRQVEARLRRFVGELPAEGRGWTDVLAQVPSLDAVLAAADRAAEIGALDAQARAAASYAESVAAGRKPQVSWIVSGSKAVGAGNPSTWSAGVSLSVPLYDPAAAPQESAARRRAEAARLQRDDAVESRRSRVQDIHEQASSALERARRIAQVLDDSDRVRDFTLQQWQQLGRRSLFDVMAAESDHYNLRISYVNALLDGEQANALLQSLGVGLVEWLR